SFRTPPVASVPLNFVSHSPGELRVSKSQVTYDVVPAPPPPVPSQGLPAPTPPGAAPGQPPCDAYCSSCGGMQTIGAPTSRVTAAGRPITVGVCPSCGEALASPGGPLV